MARSLNAPVLLAVIAATSLATTGAHSQVEPQAAIDTGNRLFRDGQVEAAAAAYLEGYAPRTPHPTLLYNLGTAMHHLGRLPEAILWYRRASAAGDAASTGDRSPHREAGGKASRLWRADDPWLEENLWLARRSLGSRSLRPAGPLGWLARYSGGLRWAAITLGWISLLMVVARPAMQVWPVAAAAALAISLYGGALALERWGPQPAVILRDCPTPAGELPAGTEAWVLPAAGGWRISGTPDRVCPPDAVELVAPAD